MSRIVIGLVVAFLMVTQTEAASIKVWSNDYVGAMRIEGEIEIGDAKKFYDAVNKTPTTSMISKVQLFSSGGNVYEAMKLGMMVRHLMMETVVPSKSGYGVPEPWWGHDDDRLEDESNNTCDSACFFIYVGGVVRTGSWLRVHRPTLTQIIGAKIDYGTSSKVANKANDDIGRYLRQMQVPAMVQDIMNSTPSYELKVLDDEIVKTLELSPSYEEWLVSKCGANYLSQNECVGKAYRQSTLKAREAFEATFERLVN